MHPNPRGIRREGLLNYLEALRKPIFFLGLAAVGLTGAGFPLAPALLENLQGKTGVRLAAFGVPDIFLAYVTLALGLAVLALAPALAFLLLLRLPREEGGLSRKARAAFWAAAVVLFFAGVAFCHQLTLPYGARFLLSYGGDRLEPVISVLHFVRFCGVFLVGFGIIFELPLGMILLGRLGLLRRETLARNRSHAVVAITVVSAVLTPTPDVMSLMLMAVPLYLLFELGLMGMKAGARRCRWGCPDASAG